MPLERFALIKGGPRPQKRILPRFPYCYLTFKSTHHECEHVFEVKDISPTGMQIQLKDGGHQFRPQKTIEGELHWEGQKLIVKGPIVWATSNRVGVAFQPSKKMQQHITTFLSIQNLAKAMRPLHQYSEGLDLPKNLKYWLRADGPCELFLWQHNDGELAKFQIIWFQQFVEWEDGIGLQTGRVLTKRDVETPLVAEDEFVFQADVDPNEELLGHVCELVDALNEQNQLKDLNFVQLKLKH